MCPNMRKYVQNKILQVVKCMRLSITEDHNRSVTLSGLFGRTLQDSLENCTMKFKYVNAIQLSCIFFFTVTIT